jgi:hypothetical protein
MFQAVFRALKSIPLSFNLVKSNPNFSARLSKKTCFPRASSHLDQEHLVSENREWLQVGPEELKLVLVSLARPESDLREVRIAAH